MVIFLAVAPLIIHQTLLLGLYMLIARYCERQWRASRVEFLAIYLVALTIGTLSFLYLFGFTFGFNDYPQGLNHIGIYVLFLFLLAQSLVSLFLLQVI